MEKKSENTSIPEPTLTLDDILQIMDGIYENRNRILIITSNYYDKLDSAMVRPGRIDLTLQLKNVTTEVFKEMYTYLFQEDLPSDATILSDFYTPAEIMNFYFANQSKEKFLQRVFTNSH